MSQDEQQLELGSLTKAYLEAKQEVACLQERARRFMDFWGKLNGVLQGITYSSTEAPKMSDYPTPEDVEGLMGDLPKAKRKLKDLKGRLRESGLDVS